MQVYDFGELFMTTLYLAAALLYLFGYSALGLVLALAFLEGRPWVVARLRFWHNCEWIVGIPRAAPKNHFLTVIEPVWQTIIVFLLWPMTTLIWNEGNDDPGGREPICVGFRPVIVGGKSRADEKKGFDAEEPSPWKKAS